MMDQKKYQRVKFLLITIIILVIPIYILTEAYLSSKTIKEEAEATYVGKEACQECHKEAYKDWVGSDHDLAMDYANDSSVLGDFDNAVLVRNNQNHKCYKKEGRFFVWTDGAEGQMQEFEVKYVFGHTPLQQYLVEMEGGRLQTLSLTWNTLDSNWYYMADSVYQGLGVDHNNWLHWTNQAQNWNSMCADCHSTNLQKGYDMETDSYHTTWTEIDVSCEACHGPGSEHLVWADLAEYARKDMKNYGLLAKTSGINNVEYVESCARCHARRTSFGDFGAHGAMYDQIIPALPTEPNWYIDGQIKEEDYVYGSFTQSKMYMNDVQCNDCHNVHSGKLILANNALCTQCHIAANYDTPKHTFHHDFGAEGEAVVSDAGVKFEVGSGTQCINCHMHGQNFMGVDYRRDHSFRIPRPDLSVKHQTPNACNQCHTDQSPQWAQEYVEKWFGKSRPHHYSESIVSAREGDLKANAQLMDIIKDDLYAPSIRALAISNLGYSTENPPLIGNALQNTDPILRIAAARRWMINTEDDLTALLALLHDETRGVRFEVANRLSFLDQELIPEKSKKLLQEVLQENLMALQYNADFPIGKYNLANYYYQIGDHNKAELFYLAALAQDRELSIAHMNLANLYATMGQPLKAERAMKDYTNANPEDGNGWYNYGLILSENKKYQESLKCLLIASDSLPFNSRVDYNISMMYDFFGDKVKAEEYLYIAIDKDASYANYSNLLQFYAENRYSDKVNQLTQIMRIKFPNER